MRSEANASLSTDPTAHANGMVSIPGGEFRMGSEQFYPEEAPVHRVRVDDFSIDAHPVTNAEFARFVQASGHVTVAEIVPDAEDYPGALPEMLFAGSLVFVPPDRRIDTRDFSRWWRFLQGADWRHPYGPGSGIDGLDDHPVVHIAHADALAYARWRGMDLPTEAEWEYAARGGLDSREYAWGDELHPGGKVLANTWQGEFPNENRARDEGGDGYERTSPVGAFPPNGYGLYDMIGNVWEWTNDWFSPGHQPDKGKPCCIPHNPRGAAMESSYDSSLPRVRIPRKVIKGGSHLCAPNYCQRYRPAARHAEPVDTSTSHLGFRCVSRAGADDRPR